MRGKARAIGLIATAALALSGVAAQGAVAADFDSGAGLETITASGTAVFTVTGIDITCDIANLDGEATASDPFDGTFSEFTATREYTECNGPLPAKITGFGHHESEAEDPICDFVLHANGTADLVCETGGEVTIDMGSCIVHVPAQFGLSGVSYSNTSGVMHISINIENLTTSHTDGFLCPFSGSGEGKNGSMESTVLAEGENSEGEPVGLEWTD